MKFLCDRCKTRYSIADERVRGKILKIRCKNCSAVISVREGMDEPSEWAAPAPAVAAAPSPVPSAPVRPPPASLHEEWYVSLDGNQEGPFLLPEAQAWVSAKAADDELHCWCEGFDDWLPVEKVSHFRGLRGKVTRARTPTGRPGMESTPPPTPQAPPPREPEPKSLFAATLSAYEADAEKEKETKAAAAAAAAAATAPPLPGTAAKPGTGSLPKLSPLAAKATPSAGQAKVAAPPIPKAAAPAPAVRKAATPAVGVPKAAAAPLPTARPAAAAAAPPLPAQAAPLPATPAGPAPRSGPSLPPVQALTGPAGAPIPAASSSVSIPRAAPMFDTGPVDGGNGQSAPAADDGVTDEATRRDPIDDIEDDLSIGEVSRVVRLADVARALPAKKAAAPAAAAIAARNATASAAAIARGTGMVARVEPTEAGAEAALAVDGAPSMYQALVAQPPRRRTLLYVGAAVVVLALIAIVLLVATSGGGEDEEVAGGASRNYDDLGGTVDNPLVRRPGLGSAEASDAGVGPGSSGGTGRRPTGSGGRPTGSGGNSGSQTATGSGTGTPINPQIGPDGMPIRPLSPDDVFAMSSKMEIGTRRCYERALKDDPFLKVSKIKATITVKNTGVVSSVALSSMQGTPLATCLTAAIGRWRFRPSTEGIVSEFALVFEQR